MIKNLTQFKMGFGPMSLEIIDILDLYSQQYPLMVISSRNQVDYTEGYVCTPTYLSNKFSKNENVLLCRDHCGPYFKDADKHLTLNSAIENCLKTIAADLDSGFKLIHVDVSRVDNPFHVADKLIKFILDINPNIILEFGSEENTGENLQETLSHLDSQLEYCQQYKTNIKFFVSQTGSFIKNSQLGKFDVNYNKNIAEKIHLAGFLFKEHNGDYLTSEELQLRKIAGIDAINVAPQLGVVQTQLLFEMSNHLPEWETFSNIVYNGNKYQRWLPVDQHNNKNAAVLASGHYFFNSKEYSTLLNKIDKIAFNKKLTEKIFETLNVYNSF